MSGLNMNQVQDTLNSIFNDENRVIVFWYDGNKEFKKSLSLIDLEDVKFHILSEDNIFKTKVLLEVLDKSSDYLVYAPFKRPVDADNYLIDIIKYSKTFTAEMTALILDDLDISLDYQSVLDTRIDFFASDSRKNKFVNLLRGYKNVNVDTLVFAMISTFLNVNIIDLDTLLSKLISLDSEKRNKFFDDLKRFNLTKDFWEFLRNGYGYIDNHVSIDRFIIASFAKYADIESPKLNLSCDLDYSVNDRARVIKLIDNHLDEDSLIKASRFAYDHLKENNNLNNIEYLVNLRIFEVVDLKIIDWLIERITFQEYDLLVNGLNLVEIIKYRSNSLLSTYKKELDFLESVLYFFKFISIKKTESFDEIIKNYVNDNYKVDYYYREIIKKYENLENRDKFDELYKIIENEYTSKYLNNIIPAYIKNYDYGSRHINKQRKFYNDHLYNEKLKTMVIISDALRYESGVKLKERLSLDSRYNVELDYMLTSLPSTTAVGMASLLPNRTLEVTNDNSVIIDGQSTVGLKQRERILQTYDKDIVAIRFDDLMRDRTESIELMKGKSKIYVYHNHIDAIGDDVQTESQVFGAVDKTIDDINRLVTFSWRYLSVTNIIITADHGFIYTRSRNENFEKIDRFFDTSDIINRRFILSNKEYDHVGVRKFTLSEDLDIKSELNIHVPLSYHVFKMSGGGQNYYHGGMSPQENIVPLLKIRVDRGKLETEKVEVSILSGLNRVTSLIVKLEMLQNDPIEGNIIAANYNLYFEDTDGNVISNKITYKANSAEAESRDRITGFTFHLVNREFSSSELYYFVIQDKETNIAKKQNVKIDIAFSGDFDW